LVNSACVVSCLILASRNSASKPGRTRIECAWCKTRRTDGEPRRRDDVAFLLLLEVEGHPDWDARSVRRAEGSVRALDAR
jgi:hypothetical protein